MKRPTKAKSKPHTARNLFAELSEGMKVLAEDRLGKRKLRTDLPNKRDESQKHEDKSSSARENLI